MTRRVVLAFLVVAFFCSPGVDAKQQRRAAAKAKFKRQQPCPSTHGSRNTCPGYVIDHINPLACGGLDRPENMQWQTVAAAKAKDKWERIGCRPKN